MARLNFRKWLTKIFGYDLYYIGRAITEEEVVKAQRLWASGILRISRMYHNGEDYVVAAKNLIDKMYSYEDGQVLFKPTNAKEDQFRISKEEALSYFVGQKGTEDHGFAIADWDRINFDENQHVILNRSFAVAMGNYYFIDKKGKEYKREYTMGYKRSDSGHHLEMFLHHSSHPYSTKMDKLKDILDVF